MRGFLKTSVKYIAIVIFVVVSIVLISIQAPGSKNGKLDNLYFSGDYSVDKVTWNELSSVSKLADIKGITIFVRGNFESDIPAGSYIFMNVNNYSVQLSVNGELEYLVKRVDDYSELGVPFTNRWEKFVTEGIKMTDEVEMAFSGEGLPTEIPKFLKSLSAGDTNQFAIAHLSKHALQIFIGVISFVLGIAYLIIWGYVVRAKMDIRFNRISGGFMILCGTILALIDYDFISLIFDNIIAVNTVDFIVQIMMFLFMYIYFSTFARTRRAKAAASISFWALLVAGMLFPILNRLGICTMKVFLQAAISMAMVMAMLILILLAAGLKQHANDGTRTMVISAVPLVLTAVFEQIYYIISGNYLMNLTQIGMLIFFSAQVSVIISIARYKVKSGRLISAVEKKIIREEIDNYSRLFKRENIADIMNRIVAKSKEEPYSEQLLINIVSMFISDSAKYLAYPKLVPFEKELSMATELIEVEKLYFDGEIEVYFDIEAACFEIPISTVMRLISMAVRNAYGSGHISLRIASKEMIDSYCVVVSNEQSTKGNTEACDDRAEHDLISRRLYGLCGGKITTQGLISGGSVSTIIIPKNQKKAGESERLRRLVLLAENKDDDKQNYSQKFYL